MKQASICIHWALKLLTFATHYFYNNKKLQIKIQSLALSFILRMEITEEIIEILSIKLAKHTLHSSVLSIYERCINRIENDAPKISIQLKQAINNNHKPKEEEIIIKGNKTVVDDFLMELKNDSEYKQFLDTSIGSLLTYLSDNLNNDDATSLTDLISYLQNEINKWNNTEQRIIQEKKQEENNQKQAEKIKNIQVKAAKRARLLAQQERERIAKKEHEEKLVLAKQQQEEEEEKKKKIEEKKKKKKEKKKS